VKKAKRQLIEGQLDRYVMLDDEDPQEMYNRLKKLVNKVRAFFTKKKQSESLWFQKMGCPEGD
jgi:hypothetical protein